VPSQFIKIAVTMALLLNSASRGDESLKFHL